LCGISGIINQYNKGVLHADVQQMNDLIAHRGPDDAGFFFGDNFAFGHRRLAIVDLSRDGHQPMHYLAKYTITYNGEIYNYLEIKDELKAKGYFFVSNTDTEVILAAYDLWGEECVNHFNGMWSFALYDKEKNIIFCSRDRFGIKPFYYTEVQDRFIFGSETKQLLVFYGENRANQHILIDYLVTRFQEHTNETFFQGIFKLQQAHNLVYDLSKHAYHIYRYYDIEINESMKDLSLNESVDAYGSVLGKAVELRMQADVKVGSCLSGGLDSSAVATLASRLYHDSSTGNFVAIHAKSSEEQSDESHFAREVSEVASLDLNIIEPDCRQFEESIDEVVYTQEEPFGSTSVFMQYYVMKKADELGCKVMLDGQGGDETLLGYEKYYPSAYLDMFRSEGFIQTLRAIRDSQKNNSKMSLKWIAIYTLGSLFSSMRRKVHIRQCSFVKEEYLSDFPHLETLSSHYPKINALQKHKIFHTNLPVLLRYEDKNSMRHSIETRLPFIDYKTLELALSLNIKYKIHSGWTKYILRVVIDKFLPKSIVWRKSKLGFNAPESTWQKEIAPKMLEEIQNSTILSMITDMELLGQDYSALNERLKWRLFNIACWERVYDVRL